MRYFIEFAYKGTAYHGSQVQPNGVSVQGVMQDALYTIMRTPIALTFAGRTDAGVHAQQMFAHFDLLQGDGHDMFPNGAEALVDRLNRLLPADIAVYRIYPVADDLHARFSAMSRTYEYRTATRKSPFTYGTRTFIPKPLDYAAMNEAAKLLLGKHDFASFCKVHTDVKTTICTITQAEWRVENANTRDGNAVFVITADRFLRNMVRAIVGTLFEVGRHRINADDFAAIISSRSRQAAGQSAPPQGLFLTEIVYPEA